MKPQPPHKHTLWQALRQYQPTAKLVKILLAWWLLVVLLTAIRLTKGFDLFLLKPLVVMSKPLLLLSQGLLLLILLLIIVITIVDIILLKAISQIDSYRLQREYPNNVAIFHTLDIALLLDFIPQRLHGLNAQIFNLFTIKRIELELYDDYPHQCQLISDLANANNDIDNTNNSVNNSTSNEAENKANNLTNSLDSDSKTMPIALTLSLQEEANPIYDEEGNEIAEGYSKRIVYPIQPIERGTGYFGALALRILSPLRLFRRRIELYQEEKTTIAKDNYLRVLADFTGLLTDKLSAVFEKGYDAGIQTIKEQGQGSEFLKLREYVIGDSMRQIDWKASSRQGRIMSKSYEDENDQDVIFLLDCSEQMRHKEIIADTSTDLTNIGEKKDIRALSYFDKVLNAVLLLSYVANKQGDRVGLMTFGGINNGEEKFIAPQKGVALIRHFLNETADLNPTMQTSDYYQASERLKQAINKRSLVIVITNTRQEASNELIDGMKLLSQRHQLVFANLTEQSVQDKLEMKDMPMDMDDSLLYHALTSYQQTRSVLHKRLREQTGSLCLATTADRLPFVLTNTYLQLRK